MARAASIATGLGLAVTVAAFLSAVSLAAAEKPAGTAAAVAAEGRQAETESGCASGAPLRIDAPVRAAAASGGKSKKRAGPAPVAPVVVDGVRYEALQWGKARGLDQNGGYIAAVDERTGKELWILKVYDVVYDGDKEDDKQDLFITSISRTHALGGLIVEDERGRRYLVDLATRRVTPQ